MASGSLPAKKASAQRKRLKLLRESHGYETAASFARALGISPTRFSNAENGHILSLEVALLIKALIPRVKLDWLYYGDEAGLTAAFRKRLKSRR